jgi:phosphatidylserine/phosphatidylglycerophosphate/cardiolipin synthase-like enzyme
MTVKHGAAAGREPMSPPSLRRGQGGWLVIVLVALFFSATTVGAGATALPATGSVEVLFSPWDDAEGAIIRVLGKARESIHVQAYLLTSRSIARALTEARVRGVKVEILADREMLVKSDKSLLPQLLESGIPIWLETRYAAAHNKVILIDVTTVDPVVITGSYNFSWSAQARNAENLLILRGNPALAQRYLDNWRRHRDDAEKMSGEVR